MSFSLPAQPLQESAPVGRESSLIFARQIQKPMDAMSSESSMRIAQQTQKPMESQLLQDNALVIRELSMRVARQIQKPLEDAAEDAVHQLSVTDLLGQQLLMTQKVLALNLELSGRLEEGSRASEQGRGVPTASSDKQKIVSLEQELREKRKAIENAASLLQQKTGEIEALKRQVASMALDANASVASRPVSCPQGRDGSDLLQPLLSDNTAPLVECGFGRVRSDSELSRTKSDSDNESEDRKGSKRRVGLFPDAQKMKEQLKRTLVKDETTVESYYKSEGWAQALARNNTFKNAAFITIGLNTLWIAIDTDYNKADVLTEAPWVFIIVENAFCAAFSFEILVRFLAFEKKADCLNDGWFMFDSILVLFMVWETWVTPVMVALLESGGGGSGAASILRVLRLFRLTRVARLGRLLSKMPELMVLVKGMVIAMRSVFSTLLLLVLIIYVFAIVFTQLLSGTDTGKDCFDTVPTSMNCLLLGGIFSDQQDLVSKLLDASLIYYVVIMIYLVVGSLCVMNMLIGVICEVVSVVAQVEKEESIVNEVKDKLLDLMPALDSNHDGLVSLGELQALVNNHEAVKILDGVGVDVIALVEFGGVLFEEQKELNFSDMVQAVMQFRDSNNATVKDLHDVKKLISKELRDLERRIRYVKTPTMSPRID